MLARGKQKDGASGPLYEDSTDRVLTPNISPVEASYAAFNPATDLPIAQSSFHAGFGKLVHDSKHPVRYGESVGWDARKEGELKLFSSENTETVALAGGEVVDGDFANLDFETWSDATTIGTWTKVNGGEWVTARESSVKQAGTYSCNMKIPSPPSITDSSIEAWDDPDTPTSWTETATGISRTGGGAQNDGTWCGAFATAAADTVYQDLTWSDTYQGVQFTFTAYCQTNQANNLRIGIDDGVGITYSTYNDGDGDWDQETVTRTLDGSATRLRILFDFTGTAGITYVDGPMTITYDSTPSNISMYQDIDSFDILHENKEITLTGYVYTGLASNMRVGISLDGGSTYSYSDYDVGDSTWNQLTATATPTPASTGIRIVVERNSDTPAETDYVDTLAISQATASRGTPIQHPYLTWGTDYYYAENKTLFKWASTQYTEHYTFEDAIVDYKIYKNRMIVSVGTGDFYYWSDSGSDAAFTRGTDAGAKVGLMKEVSGTLWATVADAKVASATDPTAASPFTAGSSVGDSSVSITGLEEYDQTLYVGKQDNVYTLTIASDLTYTSNPIAPQFKNEASANNFKQMLVRGSTLYLCHNTGIHLWVNTSYGTLSDISPALFGPSFTDYHGAAKAITNGTDWAYVILEPASGNTKSKVMAVREQYIAEAGREVDFRWHCLGEVDQDEVYGADVHSNKLWISGTKSGTASIKSFALDGTNYPDNDALGVKVEFRIDSATSWTELAGSGLGEFTTSSTIAFQANQNGKRIQFRFSDKNAGTALFITPYYDAGLPGEVKSFRTFTMEGDTLNANGTSATPVIKSIILRTVQRTPPLRTIWCVVRVDDDPEMDQGMEKIPAATIKSQLDALATEADPVTLYDIYGNTFTCNVIPPTPRTYKINIKNQEPRKVSSEIELLFQQVRTS